MQPGREMDELVGERVMAIAIAGSSRIAEFLDSLTVQRETPHYSTEDEDAWLVVRAMYDKGFDIGISRFIDDDSVQKYNVVFYGEIRCRYFWSPSFSEAVCVAALRALGVEE